MSTLEDLKAQYNIIKSQVDEAVSAFSSQEIVDHLGREAEEQHEEMLDEVYGEFKVGELTFSAGRIVRELDPIAFRVGMDDYYDGVASDIRYDAENGDYDGICQYVEGLEEKLERLEELEGQIAELEEGGV